MEQIRPLGHSEWFFADTAKLEQAIEAYRRGLGYGV